MSEHPCVGNVRTQGREWASHKRDEKRSSKVRTIFHHGLSAGIVGVGHAAARPTTDGRGWGTAIYRKPSHYYGADGRPRHCEIVGAQSHERGSVAAVFSAEHLSSQKRQRQGARG